MYFVETRSGAVAYLDQGSGTPVVLLHATLHDHRDFAPITGLLAAKHRVIAVDWPGHGESTLRQDSARVSGMLYADVLADIVEGLDFADAVVVGNSVGGYAAARLAITHPQRLSGLVLVNTGGFVPMNPITRAYCRLLGVPAIARRVLPRSVRSYMKPQNEHDGEIVQRATTRARTTEGAAVAASLWRSFAAEEYDLRPLAKQIEVPSLIVWGAKDTTLPLRVGRATHAALTRSRLEVLDTGHVPFSSQPQAFVDVVLPFIEQVTKESRT